MIFIVFVWQLLAVVKLKCFVFIIPSCEQTEYVLSYFVLLFSAFHCKVWLDNKIIYFYSFSI